MGGREAAEALASRSFLRSFLARVCAVMTALAASCVRGRGVSDAARRGGRAHELFALEEGVVDLVLSFRDLWWRFLEGGNGG